MRFGAVIVLSVVLFTSCGQSKKAVNSVVPSKTDYAYITKFHEGVRLKSRGQVDEAILAFEQCLTLKTTDAPAYGLYELYTQKSQMEKAGEYLQKAYKADPNNIHYISELAYYNFEIGDFAKSVSYFKQLVKKEPRNPDYQYGMAEAYLKNGQPEEAIQALNKTQDQVGSVPELYVQKYNLYMQIKKPESALQELNEGLKDNPGDPQLLSTMVEFYFQQNKEEKAIETLERMAEAEPTNGRVQMYLAEVYYMRGNKEKYINALMLAFGGEGVELDQKMKAVISLQERKMVKNPRAFDLVRKLVQDYPTEAKPYTVLGDFHIELNEEDAAMEAYQTALKYEKNAFPIWQQLMILQYQKGQFENLYASSSECLEYFPSLPLVYLLKGVAANQLKKHDEAIQTISTGIEFVVNDNPTKAEMYGQLGDAYFAKKEYTEGKKKYEIAITLDAKSLLLKNNYSYRLGLAKLELDKALNLMKNVNETSPNQAHFMDTYGWIYFQKGEYTKAKEWIDQSFTISPEDKIIVEHMGDVSFQLGKTQEAITYWKKAKQLGSTNEVLDKKIQNAQYYDPIY